MPLEPSPIFDRHRFDCHSAWLDMETRKKAKAEGRPLGHGFAEPRPPPVARPERPFYVMEPAFTSGLMVQRKYNQVDVCGYKTEDERTDPYHYPNHLEVRENQHFQDARRKSQNVDPREWKPDPKLARVVTDDMVKVQLAAHKGEARSYTDPKLIQAIFDDRIRPQAQTLGELNADVSCVDLPKREGGSIASRAPGAASAAAAARGRGASGGRGGGGGGADWTWCLGGRKLLAFERQMPPAEAALVKSHSLPQMTLANQPSMLQGNLGGSSEATFHGLHTRKFGGNDLRMRGGRLARDGWAGTFPGNEVRAGA